MPGYRLGPEDLKVPSSIPRPPPRCSGSLAGNASASQAGTENKGSARCKRPADFVTKKERRTGSPDFLLFS